MRLKALALLLAFVLALLAAPLVADTQERTPDRVAAHAAPVHPSPAHSPDEVTRLQLEALAANDDPHEDAGIEVAFRFASPANKRVTGPLARFILMVHNPLYRPLLHHRAVRYGTIQVQDDHARQSVIVTARDGEHVAYVFALSKQKGGPCDGCWMTDSVLRIEGEEVRRADHTNRWL